MCSEGRLVTTANVRDNYVTESESRWQVADSAKRETWFCRRENPFKQQLKQLKQEKPADFRITTETRTFYR